jgi:uncharacterized membrane protein YfcA
LLTAYVVLVMFVAMLVQSALGFGAGMIGISLLALRLPVNIAAPLVTLLSITVALLIVVQDHVHVQFRSVGVLFVSSLFGMPLGLLLLKYGEPYVVKLGLAIVLIAFATWALTGGARLKLNSDSWIWLGVCGFCAGLLGEGYGMSGPPLLIYGAMRRWSARHFRATTQGFFLPACAMMVVGYWFGGLLISKVTTYYLWTLPGALLAVCIGRHVNRRLEKHSFHQYLYVAVLGIGAGLLIQSLHR